jgi:tetratricopeptide (TPR) repeat protein
VRTGITAGGIEWAFTSRDAANWFPLTRLSHELDCQLFGLNSGWHHLTSVAFHGATVVLLFMFLLRATRARWPSAFVAFVFALHPLHVESVAWVAERKDVLCALFWFLALWLYVRYTEKPELRRYLLVLLAFALGVLAKPMIVTLPVVLLTVDYWPLQRLQFTKRTVLLILREKIPFFALAGALAVGTYVVQRASGAVRTAAIFPIALRIENALVSYVLYIFQMFWPARLAVFYPYPREIPIWEPVFAALLLAAITVGAVFTKRTHPYLIAGWFWYLVTLLPVIGLVQVGSQAHADRYMYIPMTGLLVMLAWGAGNLLSYRTAALAAVGACACCAVVTFVQLGNWRNSETLYRHALAVTSGNYVAEHNWGTYLMDQPGRLAEAIDHLETAVRMKPDSMEARTDLGSALSKVPERLPEAVAQFRAALRIQPDSPITLNDLGNALSQMPGRLPEAIADYKAALRVQPDYADAHNNLGTALARLPGRLPDAIAEYKAALPFEPNSPQVHYNLGLALSKKPGHLEEAAGEYEEAIRLKPDYAEAHNSLGTVYAQLGRPQEAIAEYQAALPYEPNSPEVHYNLGLALAKTGRAAEAMEQFETVLRLAPDSPEAHNNLGVLLSQGGRLPEAVQHFEAAVRKNPDYAEAQYNLGVALSQMGQPGEALEHFEAAERIKPDAETEQIVERLRAALR